jgi:hypothetical protein
MPKFTLHTPFSAHLFYPLKFNFPFTFLFLHFSFTFYFLFCSLFSFFHGREVNFQNTQPLHPVVPNIINYFHRVTWKGAFFNHVQGWKFIWHIPEFLVVSGLRVTFSRAEHLQIKVSPNTRVFIYYHLSSWTENKLLQLNYTLKVNLK